MGSFWLQSLKIHRKWHLQKLLVVPHFSQLFYYSWTRPQPTLCICTLHYCYFNFYYCPYSRHLYTACNTTTGLLIFRPLSYWMCCVVYWTVARAVFNCTLESSTILYVIILTLTASHSHNIKDLGCSLPLLHYIILYRIVLLTVQVYSGLCGSTCILYNNNNNLLHSLISYCQSYYSTLHIFPIMAEHAALPSHDDESRHGAHCSF